MVRNLEDSTNQDWSTILYKASLEMPTHEQKRDCLTRGDKLQADNDREEAMIELRNLAYFSSHQVVLGDL